MNNKTLKIVIVIILLLLIGGGLYYWLSQRGDTGGLVAVDPNNPSGFSPFGGSNQPNTSTSNPSDPVGGFGTTTTEVGPYKPPKLRQLSTTPVGGMVASTTASSSIVRFVDRGTGHVFEASDISAVIDKISNTTLLKIQESYWNSKADGFVFRYLRDETDNVTNFYGQLISTGTTTTETPFEIKGTYLSPDIDQVAVSPTGERIFTWNIENGRGVGYLSSLNQTGKTKIIDSPLTQVTVDWPTNNNVTISTKASASASGFIYSANTQTGKMTKLLGNIRGLSAKASKDMSKLLYSFGTNNNIQTSILTVSDNSSQEVIFRTLADKCVWSNLRKNEVYCAVPTEIPDGVYPDDWYKGNVSFIDQIWILDASTGEVHLLANPLTLANQLVDAIELTLDPKDNFLYFINKRDLTLWALDLNQ